MSALGGDAYLPDVGVPEAHMGEWSSGALPAPGVPETHWEWHSRFPETAQFLGGWFSQDFPEEFTDHDEAVRDYLHGTHLSVTARLLGELTELLAVVSGDADLLTGLLELSMEVDPPGGLTPGAWVRGVADRLQAGFGPESETK